jgi:hypothetical protein
MSMTKLGVCGYAEELRLVDGNKGERQMSWALKSE